jgi:HNH endonuclease
MRKQEVIINCHVCNTIIITCPCKIKRKKYCSIKCRDLSKVGNIPWNKGTGKIIKRFCVVCGNPFSFAAGDLKFKKRIYCSKDCACSVNSKKRIGTKVPYKPHKNMAGRVFSHKEDCSCFRHGGKVWNKGLPPEQQANWQGGLAELHEGARKAPEYKIWRKAVKERDGWKCIWCGSKERLEVDHIKSFADYPEVRFAIDNGRTLCHNCHVTTDNYGYKGRGKKNG